MQKKLSLRLILSILAIALLGFTNIMLETALNVSFPELMSDLNVNSATVQWLTSGVILLTAMVIILSPWLKARFTNRTQFMVAGAISLIGILIDATANQFGLILFGRFLQGIGAGVGLPLMNNVVFEQVPEERRGTMVGLASLIVAFSPALGPAFGGLLTSLFGWHMIFWVVLPIQVFALILGWFTIMQIDEVDKKKPLDWIGWLLLSSFFIGLLMTIDRLSTEGLLNPVSLFFALLTIAGIVGYYFYAKRTTDPLLTPEIFSNKLFRRAVIAATLVQMNNLTYNYAIPMGLQLVLGKDALVAGLSLFPGAVCFALMSILSGNLYDRYGAKLPNTIGIVFLSVGVIWMLVLPFEVWTMTVGFILTQIGGGFWVGSNMTNAISHLQPIHYNAGNSVFATTQNYSASVGIAIAAAIVSVFQQGAQHMGSATLTGIEWAYRLALLMMVGAVWLSYLILKSLKREA
ncbi:MFS transporter [Leuconostocaceae bacterium ESL0958]|nr:MFS transporter [Leuconostocaceae bacterium ESL0958]